MTGTVTAKPAVSAKVETRVKEGKCLLCDSAATRRGLCMNHYQTFLRRQREKDSRAERLKFEEACIREGKVLAVHQMGRIKRPDPFDV